MEAETRAHWAGKEGFPNVLFLIGFMKKKKIFSFSIKEKKKLLLYMWPLNVAIRFLFRKAEQVGTSTATLFLYVAGDLKMSCKQSRSSCRFLFSPLFIASFHKNRASFCSLSLSGRGQHLPGGVATNRRERDGNLAHHFVTSQWADKWIHVFYN